ncbi:MAG: hypothetical protein WC719_00695 [Patescibacteria group bacterium]|jgi:tetratricopeptide (TPR) repeat protein
MLNFLRSPRFLKILVFLGLLGLVVLIFSQPIDLTTSDLGRHLVNGRVVWSNPDILFHNAYSYTEPDFRFINHHWLYGVIVYSIYRLAGFVGLSLFNILIILAAFSLAFYSARQKISLYALDIFGRAKVDGFFLTSLVSLPVILLLSERVEVRPEIISYLLIIFVYAFLDSAEETKKYRRLWFLLPLFVLWANIHIYFFIGLALVGFKATAAFIGALMEKEKNSLRRLLSAWRTSRLWLTLFSASVLACLINPNTWRGLIYPFNIFQNYGYEIAENKSVFFLDHLTVDHNFFIFKLVGALLLISWVLYFSKRSSRARFQDRLADIFLSLLVSGLAIFSSRNISLFGLISLILISANMAPVLINIKDKDAARLSLWRRFFVSPFPLIHSYVLIFLLILIASSFWYLRADARRDNHLIRNSFGLGLRAGNEASAAFFKEKNLSGPIFNNYDIGSALIFWRYSQEKVFVDNRPEAYSDDFFNSVYKPMQSEAAKWEEYSQIYDFKTVYFAHTDGTPWAQQFLARILQDGKWRLAYFDAYAVILINTDKYSPEEVKALSLEKWALKSGLRELAAGASTATQFRLANLARLAGMPELAEEIYREILLVFPDQARTLSELASLYAGYGDSVNLRQSLYYYQRALSVGSRLPGIYNELGLVYWRLGEYKKAESAWRSALQRERKNIHALYYLNQVEVLRREGELPSNQE